ncbi:hypothetical protein M5K25_005785 [Dendrobium thyrsiflorum]|uniref:Uncharacterized protein n=1 Tax=Dendrobium thyrsiflorum TaxID=117978 RepID=A0ABD0VID7_DENTH
MLRIRDMAGGGGSGGGGGGAVEENSCSSGRLLIRHQKIIMIGHESRSKIKLETFGIEIGIIRTPISANL